MFDMSWGEMLIIGAAALIVIGPKDLPKALRTVGNMVGKVRRMAGEFQGQFQEAMREAELDTVRRDIDGLNKSVSSFDPVGTIRDEIKGAVDKPGGAAATSAAATGAAAVAAAETAAFAGTGVAAPADPGPPLELHVPPPDPAPPVDLSKEFDAAPATDAAVPAPEPLPEAEPRRAQA